MGKPKVFVTRIIPNEGLDQIRAFCDATVWEDELPPSREVILRETHDADGLVSLLTDKIDGALMDACPQSARREQLRRRLRQPRYPGRHASAASRLATRRACSPKRRPTSPSRC